MLKPGGRFGDYAVVRLLGKGGMGSVFLLEDSIKESERERKRRNSRNAKGDGE